MVFELQGKRKSRAREEAYCPLAAGGRYDRLLTLLGSAAPVPAVGFAVWVERLEQAGGRP
jgi:ATP phosphoribosyltransferase regulatory subunit